MLLILIIYYLVSLTNSLREANNDLKIQLRRERTEERRKMFQMVDKRARKGSKDSETPFAKWKKLLPDLSPKPVTPIPDLEKGEKIENGGISIDGKKEANRKELLSRLMKKALRKSSGTSDDDSQIPDDGTDGEHQDSLFDESVKPKKKQVESKIVSKKKPDIHQVIKSEKRTNVENVHKKKKERKKSPTSGNSTQRNSLGSEWSENIPVITISKTESDECMLKEKSPKEEVQTRKDSKGKFKEKVEKEIIRQRQEKERISKQMEKKASEMQKKEKVEEKSKTKSVLEKKAEEEKVKQEELKKEKEKEEKNDAKEQKEEEEKAEKAPNKESQSEEKKCPIATEETVSSDLDLSLVSLKVDENNASQNKSTK